MRRSLALPFMLTLAAGFAPAAIYYDNTHTDQGDTLFFSSGPYLELGDQIRLSGGVGALLQSVSLQLFNSQTAGTFDAVLGLYAPGSGSTIVGEQIGDYSSLSTLTAPALSSFDLTFILPNVRVPNEFIVMLAVRNAAPGVDLGVNLFDPPFIGSSDSAFMIARSTGGYLETATPFHDANIYLQVNGTPDVPEPATAELAAGMVLLLLGRRWAQRHTNPRTRPVTAGATR